jgi:hypothetical protein
MLLKNKILIHNNNKWGGKMEYRGYGKFLTEIISRERYGTAIFADDVAVVLALKFAIPMEHAKKVVNVNLKRLADRGIIERLKT